MNTTHYTLRVAINGEILYKANPSTDGFARYSLTHNFHILTLTVDELVRLILARHSFTCICLDGQGNFHRKGEHFKELWVAAADIDNDNPARYVSYDDAKEIPFVKRHGAFIYTTPSHTESLHKFRLAFLPPEPFIVAPWMTNEEAAAIEQKARKFILALQWKLGEYMDCDPSCKDSVRFYFGSGENGRAEIFNRGPMSQEAYDNLMAEYEAAMEAAKPKDPEPYEPIHLNESVSGNLEARQRQYNERVIQTAIRIIYDSRAPQHSAAGKIAGSRHHARLRAGYLLGGFIAGGTLTMWEVGGALESVIAANTDNYTSAMQSFRDAIHAGMSKPITLEFLEAERKRYLKQFKVKVPAPRIKALQRPSATLALSPPSRPLHSIRLDKPLRPTAKKWKEAIS